MWLFQSPKQRLRAVALEIVQGLADGTIVPDPQPFDDRVVVEPLATEPWIFGGLILLEGAQRGRVVAVGPGKLLDDGKRVALTLAKGDQVLYGKHSGDDAKVDSKEVKILRESDILAKIVQ